MLSWLARIAMACWRPVSRYARMNKDDSIHDDDDSSIGDSLLWSRDLEKHSYGDFSFAVVQANETIEDHSQVETGRDATFIGVYDGHGGPEASRFISDHLFKNLMRFAGEIGSVSEETLRRAFSATEEGFLTLVRRTCSIKPLIAAIGSCCLVGVIWRGTLYIANLGDSRAVIGCLGRSNKIVAEQLTKDHNASMEEVRQELKSLHPDDSHIVVMKHGVWRIKGIIQVSRSIGDAYLKKPEFSLDPSFPRFHLPEPIRRPVLTSEPSISSRVLRPNDKFVIFASDGLWEHMTNQEAVEMVYNYPRAGIARRLVKTALKAAARKREMRYDDLKKINKGNRRFFHDDITVIVIFTDHELQGKNISVPELSMRGFIDTVGPSRFNTLHG
ncbi:probable protein phosphatase 2C 68 [Ricinus communis]|uniref:protein-serine/threonine phosphatase n=1 Tax=Ricinus communis TaxID=3988 RepID=B9SXJ0_RICCO|nr:probable protein phosphatase 2C 68 [Ricinus communis]EEF31663.1 protein phosphatase 2c, putative [Ricinus communis]|eukprot:XP_002530709.1 probable protein phosphatase 2C 68 [Ricinus communis]